MCKYSDQIFKPFLVETIQHHVLREDWQMSITEQLFYQTQKSSHRRCSKKKVFVNVCSLKEKTCIEVYLFNKVAIQMFSNECCEISKNAYFEEHLRMAASELTLGSNYL